MSNATPELAWGLMIATVRHLGDEHARMRAGGWQSTAGIILAGRTLGLLGLGRIGKRMAHYAQAFGMEVIAWSQNLKAEDAAAVGVRRVEKDELFAQADVISIHLVLSDRTRGLVTARELGLMKPDAYLINTSRGPIVDEAALMGALSAGRIAGAGIDVYWSEPPAGRPSAADPAQRHPVAAPRLCHARDPARLLWRQHPGGRRLPGRRADPGGQSAGAGASGAAAGLRALQRLAGERH
ncbi:MAG: NAD(P)-dependent oxidoreductase [Caulobacteraceae bacterium]